MHFKSVSENFTQDWIRFLKQKADGLRTLTKLTKEPIHCCCIPPLFIIAAAILGLKHSYFLYSTFHIHASQHRLRTHQQAQWKSSRTKHLCKSLPILLIKTFLTKPQRFEVLSH